MDKKYLRLFPTKKQKRTLESYGRKLIQAVRATKDLRDIPLCPEYFVLADMANLLKLTLRLEISDTYVNVMVMLNNRNVSAIVLDLYEAITPVLEELHSEMQLIA